MDQMETEWTFPLSAEQFFFLTQIMGVHHVAGFKDPFQGYLSSELETQYKLIEQDLVKEGYLISKEGGIGYDLNEMLGASIAATGSENVIFVKKFIADVGQFEGYFYFMPNIVVERTCDDINDMILTPVANAVLSINVIKGLFPLTLRSRSTNPSIIIPECTWEQWDGLEKREKLDLLISSGCATDMAEDILNVIYSANRSGSMVFMKRSGYMWHQEGYHYAQLGEELYLVRELSSDSIQIEPYKPDMIKKALNQFIGYLDLPGNKGVE